MKRERFMQLLQIPKNNLESKLKTKKFKVLLTKTYESTVDAETREDAAILTKYKSVGSYNWKLLTEDVKLHNDQSPFYIKDEDDNSDSTCRSSN